MTDPALRAGGRTGAYSSMSCRTRSKPLPPGTTPHTPPWPTRPGWRGPVERRGHAATARDRVPPGSHRRHPAAPECSHRLRPFGLQVRQPAPVLRAARPCSAPRGSAAELRHQRSARLPRRFGSAESGTASHFLAMSLDDGNDTCHRSRQDVERVKLFRSQFKDARVRAQLIHAEKLAGGVEMIPERRPSYFVQRTDATLAMFRHYPR